MGGSFCAINLDTRFLVTHLVGLSAHLLLYISLRNKNTLLTLQNAYGDLQLEI